MVAPYNGVVFSFKKEGRSDTGYDMDGPEDITQGEISQSQKDNA